jgi:hypothetical protein
VQANLLTGAFNMVTGAIALIQQAFDGEVEGTFV